METRDKLFTEEQYLKQLKMYDEDISYYEQMHLSGKHIGYDSLFNYRLRYLLVQYSMGQDIDKLKNNYVKALKTMPRFWTDNGFYIEMLWLLSIGIMLDYEDDLIHGLVQLIKDREAKDYIYDTLIRYRFPDWERTTNQVLRCHTPGQLQHVFSVYHALYILLFYIHHTNFQRKISGSRISLIYSLIYSSILSDVFLAILIPPV